MDNNKMHILSSFKNEQETINEIEAIKAEKANPLSTSESGYNVEFNNHNLERPLPERVVNNRIK